MIPWQVIDRAKIPNSIGRAGQCAEIGAGRELVLSRRGELFSLRIDNWELMNSRAIGSERELARLACEHLVAHADAKPALLIGGLGMGFTLRAALDHAPAKSRVIVAELVPEVVGWNRTHLAHLADAPLGDPRVTVYTGDIADHLRQAEHQYDAIALDVDNGPPTTTTAAQGWLYSSAGLRCLRSSLAESGVIAFWSAGASPDFTARLEKHDFAVVEHRLGAHGRKGFRHRVWLAEAR